MSLEKSAESVEILLLQGQAALSGFSINHYDEDTDPDKDRIIVKASPRQVSLPGKSLSEVRAWSIPVEITVHYMTRNATSYDTVIAAIEAANDDGSTPPAAAVTAATSAFPGGCKIEDSDEGQNDHSDNSRTRSRTFNFIIGA